ncbi:hypothetical protein B0H19DRAFT_1066476 [Mycena capillaripes]|nr:hypothetical protein B0H19DRAFT_1066476 [Mycena capillaripes]
MCSKTWMSFRLETSLDSFQAVSEGPTVLKAILRAKRFRRVQVDAAVKRRLTRRSKIKERRSHAVEAFVAMKSKLDAAVTRRDTVVKRRSAVGCGEVDGKFAASHHFDAAVPPQGRGVSKIAHRPRCWINQTATDLVDTTLLTPFLKGFVPTTTSETSHSGNDPSLIEDRRDAAKCTAAPRPSFHTASQNTGAESYW